MCVCASINKRTYVYIYIYICIYTYIHIYIYMYTLPSYLDTYVIPTYLPTYMQTDTCTPPHPTHPPSYTYACIHLHTSCYIHLHTHFLFYLQTRDTTSFFWSSGGPARLGEALCSHGRRVTAAAFFEGLGVQGLRDFSG